jgi:hypothetical protein
MNHRAAVAERQQWKRQAQVTAWMALLIAAGFSLHLAMGRSSFDAPPIVHIHALLFFGWVVLAFVQSALAAAGRLSLHRPLGWLGAAWLVAMLAAALGIMQEKIGAGTAPFVFKPQIFLFQNFATVGVFAGLTGAAILLRRQVGWHRRLHLCALAALMGPAFGRLLPMPYMMPWALELAMLPGLAFPAWVAWREWREDGALHPAWLPGIAVLPVAVMAAWAMAQTPLGDAAYAAMVAGRPGEQVPGLEFPPPPPGF